MTAYLQNWTEGADNARSQVGERMEHAASDQYRGLGVSPDDVLYISYLEAGRLHLMARLPIDELLSQDQVEQRFGGRAWEADLHAVGSGGDPISFDLVVPDEAVDQLVFQRSDGRQTRLERGIDGRISGQSLQRIRRLTDASAELLDEVLSENGRPSPPRSPQPPSAAANRAVELHAVKVVRDHYEAAGWTVEDVSADRPYDLLCTRESDERHVEVKGLAAAAWRVTLTANEVAHAQTCNHVALGVVSQIAVAEATGRFSATGGNLDLFDPWELDDRALRATVFTYEVPVRGDAPR